MSYTFLASFFVFHGSQFASATALNSSSDAETTAASGVPSVKLLLLLLFPATAFAGTCDARFTLFFEFKIYFYVLLSSALSVALVLSICQKKCCIFQAMKILK